MATQQPEPFTDPIGKVLVALSDDDEGHKGVPLRIIGLLKNAEKNKVFALAWKVNSTVPKGYSAFYEGRRVGTIKSFSDIAPEARSIDRLFAVVEFDQKFLPTLMDQSKQAAVTRDLTQNIFANRGILVKRSENAPTPSKKTAGGEEAKSKRVKRHTRQPRLVGNIFNPRIAVDGEPLRIERAMVVKTRGQLASDATVGEPVLSSNNALVGFVLGNEGIRTFVLPAIDIENKAKVTFQTTAGPLSEGGQSNRGLGEYELKRKKEAPDRRGWRKSASEF